MTDAELLQATIDATGLSARRFASDVLDVDERTLRYWLTGRAMPWTVIVVCDMIRRRPARATTIMTELAGRKALVAPPARPATPRSDASEGTSIPE